MTTCLLLPSPLGPLLAEYDDAGVRGVRYWRGGAHPPAGTRDAPARGDELGQRLESELREYFRGERRGFSVALAPEGTEFQRAVWRALVEIPFGETRSYAQLAAAMGRPGAARAVGQANGRNPIPILVPCHRVIAASGGIGGYMGVWGEGAPIDTKRWLLEHERAMIDGE
jgi:methylated-DNA-[protein]-cysteine S-methyltransferase